MMGAVEMLALSLGLSVVVAALGLAGGTLVERMSDDPRLRDRTWGAALLLPLLPPVATALLLLTPAPRLEMAAPAARPVTAAVQMTNEAPAAAQPVEPSLDPGLIAPTLLIIAGGLVLLRLMILTRRAMRLSALLRSGQAADAGMMETVQTAARTLGVSAPPVVVSPDAAEPLLAGLRPARLVLPTVLPENETVRQAIITHELAHLKRGDHRALWVEELALAVLAANPLMPLLRARRSAAREEACDAVALAGAGTETRRAYAQSLIEALRTRAGPQTVGAVPALTFTGAGRTTAMHRLKAVLSPAVPATRRARIGAVLTGVAGLALVGAGSAALAAQREPVVEVATQHSATVRFEPDPSDAAQSRGTTGAEAPNTPVQTQSELSGTISFEPNGEMEARYRNVSAATYRDFCAGDDVKDKGFCVGVLFNRTIDEERRASPRFCPPADLPVEVNDGVLPVMARLSPRADEGAYEYAERALQQAYPCVADRATAAAIQTPLPAADRTAQRLSVRIAQPERIPLLINEHDVVRIVMEGQPHGREPRNVMAQEYPVTRNGPIEMDAFFDLRGDQLPSLTSGRVYTLTAEVRGRDGTVRYSAEPTTIRLGPGSNVSGLRPELMLRP